MLPQKPAKKTSQKSKAISDLERKEMIRMGLLKKKECESKAVSIVQRLVMDDTFSRDWFREATFYLNTNYYDDIIEERSCSQICGYPLCKNILSKANSFGSQKYHISTVHNKVFDVTERKKFCSNVCFKSSGFVKSQLLESPLWLRENDDKVAIKFLDELTTDKVKDATSDGHGSEVLFSDIAEISSIVQEVKSLDPKLRPTKNTEGISKATSTEEIRSGEGPEAPMVTKSQVAEDSSPSLIGLTNDKGSVRHVEDENIPDLVEKGNEMVSTNISPNASEHDRSLNVTESSPNGEVILKTYESCDLPVSSFNEPGVHSIPDKNSDMKVKVEPKMSRKVKEDIPAMVRVLKSLNEWFSIESISIMYGTPFLRKLMKENDLASLDLHADEDQLKEVPDTASPEVRIRYLQLCRQLDLMEIQESNHDHQMLETSAAPVTSKSSDQCKKLPDFEQLRKDAEDQQLKISMYLKGKTESESEVNEERPSDNRVVTLPLVDKHAQVALRRRIVHEQLDRVLPDILELFELSKSDISNPLRQLINTFSLGPDNIVLKPQEWTLMAIFLLRMLHHFEPKLKTKWSQTTTKKFVNLILLSYGAALSDIDCFIGLLHSDIKTLLGRMSLCVQ